MEIDTSNSGNIADITGVYYQITVVGTTTSDVPTPVPEPIPEIAEVDNTESEEGDKESNHKDETVATTPPQISINEYSDR